MQQEYFYDEVSLYLLLETPRTPVAKVRVNGRHVMAYRHIAYHDGTVAHELTPVGAVEAVGRS